MTQWRDLTANPITETSDHLLLWREDWIEEDFCPTGVLMGFFQEGAAPGEAHYGIAGYNSTHDEYIYRQLYDPAEWPTHSAEVPTGPTAGGVNV